MGGASPPDGPQGPTDFGSANRGNEILAQPTTPVRPQPTPDPELAAPAEARPDGWRAALRDAVRDPAELCRLLGLEETLAGPLAERGAAAAAGFPLLAPRSYIDRMRPGDPNDPLLRQVLPLGEETDIVEGFAADPVGDSAAELTPGLLQKYEGRALLVTTGACAVHCRYCFRRHFPYGLAPKGVEAWRPALEAIAADDSIHEAILSGGDPLTLVDATLAELAARLAAIPHLKRLRIHTRLPIVLPERVTDAMLGWLTGSRLAPVVVLHANHANELAGAAVEAIVRLRSAGVLLLNQSVLLRGVNDTADAQAALCERLVEVGVTPYYLHQLDRVAGAAHFEVPVERGRAIVAELRRRLPGYLIPKYVQEIAGEPHKTVLT
ncbi:L-lysine 2,3-aminomutase [Pseudobythopirellula maris]|uniref:L-lysine 2,3-aminomutase n=1 Tax=Pseudobythopirellula maris TaxID=2527991 RepID=A0A5C5ZTM5_9BACT|nr:L-lysine 2,3-aminomutase [Pseudobythopirellula maris]